MLSDADELYSDKVKPLLFGLSNGISFFSDELEACLTDWKDSQENEVSSRKLIQVFVRTGRIW